MKALSDFSIYCDESCHLEHDGIAPMVLGSIEAERTPDLRRCERIGWPAPIINNSRDTLVRCWENVRKGDRRIILWLVAEDYVVVLSERNGYLLPWTAYILTHQHSRQKMEREYQAYIKAKGSPF